MNMVSKYIYFAEVFDVLKIGSGVLSVILGIATLVLLVGSVSSRLGEAPNHVIKTFRNWSIGFSIIFIMALVTTIFTPSQKTMLMIAASEATGVVVASPEAKSAMDKILNKIDKKLSEDK